MRSQVRIGQSRTGFRLVTERARTGEHFWKELDELKHERWSNRWGRCKTHLWSPVIFARVQTYIVLGRCWGRWCRLFPHRARHYGPAITRESRLSLSKFPSLYHLGRVVHSSTRPEIRSGKVVGVTVRRYRLPVAYEECVIRDRPKVTP